MAAQLCEHTFKKALNHTFICVWYVSHILCKTSCFLPLNKMRYKSNYQHFSAWKHYAEWQSDIVLVDFFFFSFFGFMHGIWKSPGQGLKLSCNYALHRPLIHWATAGTTTWSFDQTLLNLYRVEYFMYIYVAFQSKNISMLFNSPFHTCLNVLNILKILML